MSPLQEQREAMGLSVRGIAEVLGLDYVTWYRAELHARGVPRRAREPLRELGCDPDELSRRQAAWQEERAVQLRRELKKRLQLQSAV